ncbi:hypothetical protein BKP35_05245 [Anaerobacillus arseniciselenatis]|uniref:Uncharacterized protein n=1 Tax=Anaerobacillus arseniciselenatis TaxID=85682 RepID=A0A1S2LV65_9BACI|nr:hypothetical protein [Anaerobacillus arseniciselenatis]OIJ15255.1 hypothetical protein BKP35_05245 [Anaerobacillus arseniciselenatis]
MPITGKDMEEMKDHLKNNWRLEDGRYVVLVEDVNISTVADGKRPLCWELKVVRSGRKLQKFHWIEKAGGVGILITDLQNLGMRHITPDNAINACNSLIGKKIEINVEYNGEYQNIIFLRKIE